VRKTSSRPGEGLRPNPLFGSFLLNRNPALLDTPGLFHEPFNPSIISSPTPPKQAVSPPPSTPTSSETSLGLLTLFLTLPLLLAGLAFYITSEPSSPSSFIITPTPSAAAMSPISRTVSKSVLAVAQSEGAGAIVKRSIGSQKLRNLSPFLMLDEFNVAPGAGFPVRLAALTGF
jgi:hypothetical protein